MACPFLLKFREADAYTGRKYSAIVKWLFYKHANSQVLMLLSLYIPLTIHTEQL